MQWPTAEQSRRYQEWQDQHGHQLEVAGELAVSRQQDALHLLNQLLAVSGSAPVERQGVEKGDGTPPASPPPASPPPALPAKKP